MRTEPPGEPESRLRWKVWLIRHLTECRHDRETTLELFRLIDWMVRLPPELDVQFDAEVLEMEEKTTMPYVTGYEQRGEQRATLRELRESALSNLRDRFDFVPALLVERVQTLDAPEQLRWLRSQAIRAATLEAFTAALEDDAVRSGGV